MYATFVRRIPTNPAIAITMPLLLGREMYREAATPLVNHKDAKAVITRFEVTSS